MSVAMVQIPYLRAFRQTANGGHDATTSHVRGCDLWTFRDGLVTGKDSFSKIVEPTVEG